MEALRQNNRHTYVKQRQFSM